ncbi:hypothetical protein QUF80_05015 [Desulfococcaceae bacterium HSG8]|nr:hypothetical protein [Desulfococcaceae bacterium HSG8]
MRALKIKETFPAEDVFYPESDGKPMADNTRQYRWIVKIKEGLEILFADDPDVFVAADLLWYPTEDDNKTRAAPDVMVALGRDPKETGDLIGSGRGISHPRSCSRFFLPETGPVR